jgi:hypothetical protein
MRIVNNILILSLLAFSSAVGAKGDCGEYKIIDEGDCRIIKHDCGSITWDLGRGWCLRNYEIDIDGDTIILHPKHRGYARIKITDDYRLYVNGRRIELDDHQRELVKRYHHLAMQIQEDAREIGREGAKIGVAGAKLGVDAIVSITKLLRWDYDSDDLEREIEQKAAKLEAKAERLEAKAEKIEAMADELEEIEDKLEREIPEMRERNRF